MRKIITAKDSTKVLLREPKMSDLKQLLNYINEAIAEPGININLNKKVTLKEERIWLKGVLKNIKKRQTVKLIIEHNGKICGNLSIERKPMNTRESHRAVFGIIISKAMRNKGLAQKTIPILIKLAKKRMKGLEIIELDAFKCNNRAIHVYEKMGFKKITELPDHIKKSGKYIPAVVMYYYLKKH